MANKNKLSQSGIGDWKMLIIVTVGLLIAWIVGKGILTLFSSVKHM